MAYDRKRRVVIRFGGWTGNNRIGDTWQFDGNRWMRLTLDGPGPAARNHTSMTYDSRRGVLVLFGGHDGERAFGDTWEWNGSAWSPAIEKAPRLRVDNGH